MLRHGTPQTMITEIEKCLIAELTIRFHPQTNGLCETLNRTLAFVVSTAHFIVFRNLYSSHHTPLRLRSLDS